MSGMPGHGFWIDLRVKLGAQKMQDASRILILDASWLE
jgi:hypothetical protein